MTTKPMNALMTKEYLISYREGQLTLIKMINKATGEQLNIMGEDDNNINVRWYAEPYDSRMNIDMDMKYENTLYERVEDAREEYYGSDDWLHEKIDMIEEAKRYCYENGLIVKDEWMNVYDNMLSGLMKDEIGLLEWYVSKVKMDGSRNVKFKSYE